MINHKIKLAFALFVVSTAYFSGASLQAYAETVPFCHVVPNGNIILLQTDENGKINGHDGPSHSNDTVGDECVVAFCGEGFELVDGECIPFPEISIDNVTELEGDSGTTNFVFTVTRTGDLTNPSSVDFTTNDNTTTADSDYEATSGTANFAGESALGAGDGDVTTTISVLVKGDTDVEPDETFTVDLSDSSGATIVDGQGLGTILNDDVPPPLDCPTGTHEENGECVDDVPPPLEWFPNLDHQQL